MTLVVLRDDDANATTAPERLARAYAPLLEAGFPVALSVIPEVALDTLAPDGARERFINPDVEARAGSAPLARDSALVRWSLEHSTDIAILQHGLSHTRARAGTEFGSLGFEEARARVARGRSLLVDAFGEEPEGFVAPWDRLSRGSMKAVLQAYRFVSTSWVDLPSLPVWAWPAHVRERLQKSLLLRVGGRLVLRHGGGWLMPHTSPDDVPGLVAAHTAKVPVTLIMLHHWMFWEADEPHPVVRALAKALVGRRVVRPREVVAELAG